VVLDSLLENEDFITEELECYFLEALYCSLGACLLENGRQKFDGFIKKLSSLNNVHDEKVLAGPGQIPGEVEGNLQKCTKNLHIAIPGIGSE